MICISVGNKELISEARELGPDLIELRVDLLREEPEDLFPLIGDEIGIVVACRPGFYTEDDRLRILRKSIDLGAAYVDVEIESVDGFTRKVIDYANSKQVKSIVSYHNYDLTPDLEELRMIYRSCLRKGARVVKIATMVNDIQDTINLLSLYGEEEAEKVILGMGKKGRISRVAAMELGAAFTFASMSEGEVTAPGQLSYAELNNIRQLMQQS